MRLTFTDRFWRSYHQAPPEVQSAFDRKVLMLEANIRHPSLRAKKFNHSNDIWQARVNDDWRFYFLISDDQYMILDTMAHPK
jgi:plasmid maintenance system killer protein